MIGIMSIVMIGGVYCPFSPTDPEYRLHALIEQIQGRLVLVHYLTKTKFYRYNINNDIDLMTTENILPINMDVNRLSNVRVSSNNTAYIIFTSGSTGTPKAVCFYCFLFHLVYFDYCRRHKQNIEICLVLCFL